MKELLDMNPLLVSVEDNFPMTEAGKHNLKNCTIMICLRKIRITNGNKKNKIPCSKI